MTCGPEEVHDGSPRIPDRSTRRDAPGLAAGRGAGPADAAALVYHVGRRASSSSAADGQRHARADQGVVHAAAQRGADPEDWRHRRARQDDRHARRMLAVLRGEPRAGSTLRAVARRRKRQAPLRALASVHVSSGEHDARAITCPVLHLRRRPRERRSERQSPYGDSQSSPAPRAVVPATGRGGERRSRVLGPAHGRGSLVRAATRRGSTASTRPLWCSAA